MYDEQGKLKKSFINNPNMHFVNYRDYDELDRIKRWRVENKEGSIILDYEYVYDKNSNLKQEVNNMAGIKKEYDYDSVGQLLEVRSYNPSWSTTPNKTINFEYDILGNLIEKKVNGAIVDSYEYDQYVNELLDHKSYAGTEYDHDEYGNMTKAFNLDIKYNSENQVKEINNGTDIIYFKYGINGLRTQKIIKDKKTENYFYTGDKLNYITDYNNNLQYYFLRDASGKLLNMIDYTKTTPETYWYLYDGFGSVVGLADSTGKKVVTYEYDSWGKITDYTNTAYTGSGEELAKANPFRYRGYQFDEEIEFYYLKSRYYSPYVGRFITKDAIFSKNQYIYGNNNPINYIDPDGHLPVVIYLYLSALGMSPDTQTDMIMLAETYSAFTTNPTPLSGVAVVLDGAALLVPGVQGGAGKVAKSLDNGGSLIKGMSKATDDIIAVYKSDVSHIINGSKSTKNGHAWELLFDGKKPSFEQIKPHIANAIENGAITKTQNLPNGNQIIYKSLNIDGAEVWVKEFIQNGVSRLSGAGVNNW